MSKGGGAGKVYFVLYLAVVLELLIIIVERDEAEESLHKKQKETMQIVESILSQLQAGSGSEGINTKPQDEITMLAPGVNPKEILGTEIRTDRQYLVEVGVTDISEELTKREGENQLEYVKRVKKLVELGNVEELEYQIFYSTSSDVNNAPMFLSDDEVKKQKLDFTKFTPGQTIAGPNDAVWEFIGLKKLSLDQEKTFNKIDINNVQLESTSPIYDKSVTIGPSLVPTKVPEDSSFFYSSEKTILDKGLKKRTFMVNFEPPRKAGWYKLRFASRTNRILGVRKEQKIEELSSEAKVNIGTVQLTVGDLQKVKKELVARLEKYSLPTESVLTKENDIDKFEQMLKDAERIAHKEENAREVVGKIQLYGYIVKLLAPGQSIYFSQNQASIEFNVHVLTPEPPQATPELVLPVVRSFDKLPAVFQFTISPYQGEGQNTITGYVKDRDGKNVASIGCSPIGVAPDRGGKRDYVGTVDKNLPIGKYTLVVTHKVFGKSTDRETELAIYESKLTQESEDYIKRRFDRAYYGSYHLGNQSVVPLSGGSIRPEEFRIYIKTDDQTQVAPIEGLSIPQTMAPYLNSKANRVSLKVTWKQPISGKEIDLLPEMTADIKLRPPSINLAGKTEERSQNGTKVKMTLKNIMVQTPELDETTKSTVVLKADRPTIDGIDNNSVTIDMQQPRKVSDGVWEIELEATFKFPSDKSKLSGNIAIPLTAIANAKDKTSNMKSTLVTEIYGVKEGRGGARGGASPSGGGGTRPSGGSQPQQQKPSGGRPR